MISEENYFSSYGNIDIHKTMLDDTVRTGTYERAIFRNKKLIRNKFVLDIGCGTGILSFFAATAKAKHVFAIDNSSIIETAEKIAKLNNLLNITFIKETSENWCFAYNFFILPWLSSKRPLRSYNQFKTEEIHTLLSSASSSSKILSLLQTQLLTSLKPFSTGTTLEIDNFAENRALAFEEAHKIFTRFASKMTAEELDLLEDMANKGISVIISEWMGYGLLAERMFPSVILARDYLLPLKPFSSASTKEIPPEDISQLSLTSEASEEERLITAIRQEFKPKMFPSHANIHVGLIQDWNLFDEMNNWTENVWGYDYSPLEELKHKVDGREGPIVDYVNPDCFVGEAVMLKSWDLNEAKVGEFEFEEKVSVKIYEYFKSEEELEEEKKKTNEEPKLSCHALVLWFDVSFSYENVFEKIDTSPFKKNTHWAPAIYLFDKALDVVPKMEGSKIEVVFKSRNAENNRRSLVQDIRATNEKREVVEGKYLF